jgi:hypothetical protein
VPQNPTEEMLKNTINSNVHMGAWWLELFRLWSKTACIWGWWFR